jgi:hypothetical protein
VPGRSTIRIIERPTGAILLSKSAAAEQLEAIDRMTGAGDKEMARIREALQQRLAEFDTRPASTGPMPTEGRRHL